MTISNFNQLSNKEFKIKDLIHLILFATILFGGVYTRDLYYKYKLEENKNTIAIIKKSSRAYLGNYTLSYEYKILDININSDGVVCRNIFDKINIGDTVLIKYSVDDHSISEIIDFCYIPKVANRILNT